MANIKKVWRQTDYPNIPYTTPKGTPSGATVYSGGCGFVSVLNILYNYLDMTNLDIYDIRDLAISSGARYDYGGGNSGTSVGVLLEAAQKKYNNFEYKYTTSDAEMRDHVASGGFAVMRTAGGNNGATYLFSGSGHFVTACGMNGDKVQVIDSYWYSGKWTQYSVRSNNVTTTDTRGLIYANYNAVAAACDYYYLVSKKVKPTTVKTKDKCSARSSNSSSSQKLGTVEAHVKLPVEIETTNWIMTYGYIPSKNCAVKNKKATTKCVCNIRATNSSASDLLGTVVAGAEVDVLETTPNWIKFSFFIPKKYT